MSSSFSARARRVSHHHGSTAPAVCEVLLLESRNHFSVTAAQLVGPLTNGAVYTYHSVSAVSGIGTQTVTIKTPSTFEGAPAVEADIAGPGTGDLSTSSSFYGTDLSAGFQFLGTTQAGVTFANSAGAVMFPASLTATQPVTNTYTQTSDDFSADIQVANTLESESLSPRTVGATTYHVYIVDQTLTETFDANQRVTTTYKLFIDPSVGIVESNTTDGGGNVTVVQLTSVTGLGAGGTGGGASLTPAIVAIKGLSTATSAVVGGKSSASVKVDVSNNGTVSTSGHTTVAIYLSPDSKATDGTLVRSSTGGPIKASAKHAFTLRLKALPNLANGNYFLITQVTDGKGNVSSAVSVNSYPLRAAFTTLIPTSASLKTAKNGTGTFTFTVQNEGNVPYANTFATTLIGAPDPNPANATPILISHGKKKTFAVNKPQKITLKLTAEQVTAYQTDTATYLALQITDANATQTLRLSNGAA